MNNRHPHDTLVQIEVRKLTADEVNNVGPIYGSPGARNSSSTVPMPDTPSPST
jgi:hypothetical protein